MLYQALHILVHVMVEFLSISVGSIHRKRFIIIIFFSYKKKEQLHSYFRLQISLNRDDKWGKRNPDELSKATLWSLRSIKYRRKKIIGINAVAVNIATSALFVIVKFDSCYTQSYFDYSHVHKHTHAHRAFGSTQFPNKSMFYKYIRICKRVMLSYDKWEKIFMLLEIIFRTMCVRVRHVLAWKRIRREKTTILLKWHLFTYFQDGMTNNSNN